MAEYSNVFNPLFKDGLQKVPFNGGLGDKILANNGEFISINSNDYAFQGEITVAADFPTLAAVQSGWWYSIIANVTDNDVSKTNTGTSWVAGDTIYWNGSTWKNYANITAVASITEFDCSVGTSGNYARLALAVAANKKNILVISNVTETSNITLTQGIKVTFASPSFVLNLGTYYFTGNYKLTVKNGQISSLNTNGFIQNTLTTDYILDADNVSFNSTQTSGNLLKSTINQKIKVTNSIFTYTTGTNYYNMIIGFSNSILDNILFTGNDTYCQVWVSGTTGYNKLNNIRDLNVYKYSYVLKQFDTITNSVFSSAIGCENGLNLYNIFISNCVINTIYTQNAINGSCVINNSTINIINNDGQGQLSVKATLCTVNNASTITDSFHPLHSWINCVFKDTLTISKSNTTINSCLVGSTTLGSKTIIVSNGVTKTILVGNRTEADISIPVGDTTTEMWANTTI